MTLKFKSWIASMISIGLALLMATAKANEIDLSEPVKIEPGNGIAVFSFTASGFIQNSSTLSWRKIDDDQLQGELRISQAKLGGNEEFAKSPRKVFGRLVGLSLPAGGYEFYSYRNDGYRDIRKSKQEFSRRFTVEPGKVKYVGSIDIYAFYPEFSGGRVLSGLLLGVSIGSMDVLPTLRDLSHLDLPLLASKGNGVAVDAIVRKVILHEDDMRMSSYVDALRAKADKGDLISKSQLMNGLDLGWTQTENMERIRVMPDPEKLRQLADELSGRGVAGADYWLGTLYDPSLGQISLAGDRSLMDRPAADGNKAFRHYLADARRYFRPAMVRVSKAYEKGLHDVKEDSDLWQERFDVMKKPVADAVPYINESGKAEFMRFSDAPSPRYFAIAVNGAFGSSTGDNASRKAAVDACEKRNQGAERCRIYAVNDGVVWEACPVNYADGRAMTFPPATGLGNVNDIDRLPASVNEAGRQAYRTFLAYSFPRAFAISGKGDIGMATGDCLAAFNALKTCSEKAGEACKIYAQDDQILLGSTNPVLIEEQQRISAALASKLTLKTK